MRNSGQRTRQAVRDYLAKSRPGRRVIRSHCVGISIDSRPITPPHWKYVAGYTSGVARDLVFHTARGDISIKHTCTWSYSLPAQDIGDIVAKYEHGSSTEAECFGAVKTISSLSLAPVMVWGGKCVFHLSKHVYHATAPENVHRVSRPHSLKPTQRLSSWSLETPRVSNQARRSCMRSILLSRC